MTIKTKLTWNVFFLMIIVGIVAGTSIIGMGFIKNKLFYLTERSTPFQLRTVEFQRAIQRTTTDLIKVSISKNIEEFKTYSSDTEQSLLEVKNTQAVIESLSGGKKIEVYNELTQIANELFTITEERLHAEEEAFKANRIITQKVNDASNKLKDLDTKIRTLQLNRSASFVTSLEDTKNLSYKIEKIEKLKSILKDLQITIFEIQHAKDKKALIIARGKLNTLIDKANQNEYLKSSRKLAEDIKLLNEKTKELVNLQTSILEQKNGNLKNNFDAISRDINEKLSSVILAIEQEALSATEKYNIETGKQEGIFTQSNIAINVLTSNSELVSLGFSIGSLSTRLFTLISSKEVDEIEMELKKIFERISVVNNSLKKALTKLDAKDELRILTNVENAITSIRSILLAKDGVIAKIRYQIKMKEKALQITEKLKEVVLKQSQQSKETVTTAQVEQEQAIATVNKMARFSTILIAAIGIGAAVFGTGFGIWIYRSIAKPLNELILGAEQIAQGNLISSKNVYTNDEIGMVQKSMRKMVDNLREIVGKIKTSTETLASSSEELSVTATSFEKGFNQQHGQIEQSATAMTEMAQTTLDVAKNASHTAEVAQKMRNIALQGKEAMDFTSLELQKFIDMVKESTEKVESLGQKSVEINEILILIKEIADQTNLLALNAAIEAARAGEQGRGFAVVADNVRELAERTTLAAENIANTVRLMQTEIFESVTFMQQEKNSVGRVLENVKNTLKLIDEIVSYVAIVADMVQRIAAATEEQSSASEEVSHNMENIAVVTRDLNNSIIEIKRAAEDLSKLATDLNSMAGWFKI